MMTNNEMTRVTGDLKPGYQLLPLVDDSIESMWTKLGPKSSIRMYSDLSPIVCPLLMSWDGSLALPPIKAPAASSLEPNFIPPTISFLNLF